MEPHLSQTRPVCWLLFIFWISQSHPVAPCSCEHRHCWTLTVGIRGCGCHAFNCLLCFPWFSWTCTGARKKINPGGVTAKVVGKRSTKQWTSNFNHGTYIGTQNKITLQPHQKLRNCTAEPLEPPGLSWNPSHDPKAPTSTEDCLCWNPQGPSSCCWGEIRPIFPTRFPNPGRNTSSYQIFEARESTQTDFTGK
jgi:hypothetical protein